ncbi:MAG: iron-containing alcohol dehydrogenase [Rhodospirillales bacterium]|nr:iron-containing alcohol dehydrogenase [Rhodospirillales bacterium]MDE2200776.1 iron-containing alcohol dehydrogenase [Rhodospirillales bacterium]
MDMPSFQFLAAPLRLHYGADCLLQLGRELDRVKSQRAAIVCGASLVHEATLVARVSAAMGGRFAGVVARARAHSPVSQVEMAAADLVALNADAVVAVGGGSAIVTARAASIIAAEASNVHSLCTVPDGNGGLTSPKLLAPKMPQFVVPTTPTTAMVKAGSAVFDSVSGKRLALFDPKTRAQAIFLDPHLLQSAPQALVASAAINTFATAVEGLMSRTGHPLSDATLMHSVRLLARLLPAVALRDSAALRGELALAAILCGQGTDHTGAGITTVLGHAIGARHGLENGVANAMILPHAIRFNAAHAAEGLAKIAAALGLPSAEARSELAAIVAEIEVIFDALRIARGIRHTGIVAEALPTIAESAIDDWFLRGNPRPIRNSGELLEVLKLAW